MDNRTDNWKEFTLGNPQEEPPKRVQRQETDRKKRRRLILLTAAVLAVVLTAALWDQTGFDGLRRSILYAAAEKDESGCAELYRYTANQTSRFAALGGSLLSVSDNQMVMVNEKGRTLLNERVRFTAPTLVTNGARAVVYDTGGTELYVLDGRGVLWTLTGEEKILSAAINEKNYVTVVSGKSGYKASVCVYRDTGEAVFAFNSADRFVMTAALSRDNRTLAVVTMGQEDGQFVSDLELYRTNSEKLVKKVPIDGGVYDVGWSDGCFCAVAEDGLYFIETDGTKVGSYLFNDVYLRRCCLKGNGYVSLLVSRYRSGSQCMLLCVDRQGDELGCCEVSGEVLSLDSAGRYTAALCTDELMIYDKEMRCVARLSDISEAHQVLMRADGSALLTGTTTAHLYLP